ncbi:sensor domain-containing diguanylate cyclase [Radicibacter daui]|uniref:sensor domain-containing diguanylate cyclase n=1 Tax=Radicibacter daui TaxID=3064829 RepID=UPI00404702EE
MIIVDNDRVIRFCNHSVERLLGYSESELLGQSAAMLYANPEEFVLQGKLRFNAELRDVLPPYISIYRHKSGGAIPMEVAAGPILLADGTRDGFVVTLRDISEKLAAESALRRVNQRFEDAINALDVGFAYYDEDDRLQLYNQRFADIFYGGWGIKPGASFAELVKNGLSLSTYDLGPADEAQWLQQRVDRHRNPAGPIELSLRDGQHVLLSETRTRDSGVVSVYTEITSLKAVQRLAEIQASRLQALIDSMPAMIAELAPDATILLVNQVAETWYALKREQMVGRSADIVAADIFHGPVRQGFVDALATGKAQLVAIQHQHPDASLRDVEVSFVPRRSEDGGIGSVIVLSQNVTPRRQLERTLSQLYQIASSYRHSHDDKIGRLMALGAEHFGLPAATIGRIEGERYMIMAAHGIDRPDVVGREVALEQSFCFHALLPGGEPVAVHDVAGSALAGCDPFDRYGVGAYLACMVSVDGEPYGPLQFFASAARQDPFSATELEVLRLFADWIGNELARERDLRMLRAAREELALLASTDDLTGVANRREFMKRLAAEVGRYERYGSRMAVLVLDIDHFKQINDALGHRAGDEVLKDVARATAGQLRTGDLLGRIGGEEFAVMLVEADIGGALRVAERIRSAVAALPPIVLAADLPPRQITVSIGVAAARERSEGPDLLLARADSSLYEAKHAGRNRVAGGV